MAHTRASERNRRHQSKYWSNKSARAISKESMSPPFSDPDRMARRIADARTAVQAPPRVAFGSFAGVQPPGKEIAMTRISVGIDLGTLSRRQLLRGATGAGAASVVPWKQALAQTKL